MSKTEQDLETSRADDVIDELTSSETDSEADIDEADSALDDALVESIEDYTSDAGDTDVTVTARDADVDADDVETDADEASDADEADSEVFEDEADDTTDDFEDDNRTSDVPKIVMATEDDEEIADIAEAREIGDGDDSPEVSDDILEELRKADIDGPIVEMAPQDDTTSARRRPKRAVDYDPAPVPIPLKVPRILGRKPRVRKVTRVVRHVDPWSVFKIAIIAHLVLYMIVLTASVLLWNVAYATGTVENVERFFESFGWASFEFNGGEIYHSAWIAGLFVVIGMTGLAVLAATLFNLITDLVGGVRFTVLEEEVVESRTSPMRRFVVRRPEPEIPVVTEDPSGSFIRETVVDDTGDIPR